MMSNTEATTYEDALDSSSILVHDPFSNRPVLRFTARDSVDQVDVDLNWESVKALVDQATKWLEDTKSKLPTTPGSVVRAAVPVGQKVHVILHDDGNWYAASGKWALDPSVWVYGWVLVHDAGKGA